MEIEGGIEAETDRQIELVARGLSVGDEIIVGHAGIEGTPYLDEVFHLILGFETGKGTQPPDISVKGTRGVKASVETITPRAGEDGAKYDIPLLVTAGPGPGRLRGLIKGSEFFATLAIFEVELDVRPRRVRFALDERTLVPDSGGHIPVGLRITSPSRERLKGTIRLEVRDPVSGKGLEGANFEKRISFRGGLQLMAEIPLGDRRKNDRLDLFALFSAKDTRVSELFEGVIGHARENGARVPASVEAGGNLRIILNDRCASPVMILDKDELHSELEAVESEDLSDGSAAYTFRVPNDAKGRHDFSLRLTAGEELRGEIEILKEEPLTILSLVPSKDMVRPGDKVKLTLNYLSKGPGTYRAALISGSSVSMRTEIDLLPDKKSASAYLTIPLDQPSGPLFITVEALMGEEAPFKKDFPSALSVGRDSKVELVLRTSMDMKETNGSGPDGYLLPGERARSRDGLGALTVIELDSGRRLLTFEGGVVGGCRWDRKMDCEVKRAYLLFLLFDSLYAGRTIKRISRSMDVTEERLISMRRARGHDIGGPKDLLGSGTDRSFGGSSNDLSAELMRSFLLSGDKSDRLSGINTDGERLQPVLKGLKRYLGTEDDKAGSGTLSDLVEGRIKDIKRRGAVYDRDAVEAALAVCVWIWKRASAQLKDRSRTDLGTASERAGALLFSLITSSLVRIELLSGWRNEAMSSWGDLRKCRQKGLKREIRSLLDLTSFLDDLKRTTDSRFDAYMENMKKRSEHRSLAEVGLKDSARALVGVPGETWSKSIKLENRGGRDVRAHTWIHLPDRTWQLISPSSSQEGGAYLLGCMDYPGGGEVELELEIASPANIRKDARAMLFLSIPLDSLEEET